MLGLSILSTCTCFTKGQSIRGLNPTSILVESHVSYRVLVLGCGVTQTLYGMEGAESMVTPFGRIPHGMNRTAVCDIDGFLFLGEEDSETIRFHRSGAQMSGLNSACSRSIVVVRTACLGSMLGFCQQDGLQQAAAGFAGLPRGFVSGYGKLPHCKVRT